MKRINKILAAGRQLADLSQSQLAELTGMTQQRISNIESGKSSPKQAEIKMYKDTLRLSNVIVTDKGVELGEKTTVTNLEGDDTFYKILKDAFSALKGKENAKIIVDGADDKLSPPYINALYRKIRSAGIEIRKLIKEGNTYIMGELEEYRYIPAEFFPERLVIIYGDKVAIRTQTGATIIQDIEVAEVFKNHFYRYWNISPQPTESTADEKY